MDFKERLELLQNHLDSLTPEEFYREFFGYSEEEYTAYIENDFKKELDSIVELMHNGYLGDEDVPDLSKKFYRAFRDQSILEELDDGFPTDVFVLNEHNIRMICVYGQGTLTSFELL